MTLGSAAWQRKSGPSYPVRDAVTLDGEEISFRLTRTHGGEGDQPVRVAVADPDVAGELLWRRYPTDDPWRRVVMVREGGDLVSALPHQPPAGKLEYRVRLWKGTEVVAFPDRAAVTRFKGAVPAAVLAPHILLMFTAMLLSTRAGLGALAGEDDGGRTARWTLATMVVGGLILGPAVQKAAFDAWWTGIPFGHDLTDNKTLIAALAWAWAVFRVRGGRSARLSVVFASLVTLVIFLVPHSVLGSEIDWESMPAVPIQADP
jgi:hypothetical protein